MQKESAGRAVHDSLHNIVKKRFTSPVAILAPAILAADIPITMFSLPNRCFLFNGRALRRFCKTIVGTQLLGFNWFGGTQFISIEMFSRGVAFGSGPAGSPLRQHAWANPA